MKEKLPLPKSITPEEIKSLFESQGYRTDSGKVVSIDIYDILSPLLRILQCTQWWGKLLEINGKTTGIKLDDPSFLGVPIHAAEGGQKIAVARYNTLDAALNMPREYLNGLRAYGNNPAIRADRLGSV